MSAPAKLPPELIRPKPKLIGDLMPGERGLADFTMLKVTTDADCFLDGRGAVLPMVREHCGVIEVRRDESGFHVTIPSNLSWEPGKLQPNEHSVPVQSVAIGPPDLAEKIRKLADDLDAGGGEG